MPTAETTERKQIQVRVPVDVYDQVARLAQENHRPLGGQVAFMVEQQLAEEGDK